MSRQNVYETDEHGMRTLVGWFDLNRAETFHEATRWNGSNNVSVNTGSPHTGDIVYKTAQGRWVLCQWSNWQGATDKLSYIDADTAREWLIHNEYSEDAIEAATGEVIPEEPPVMGRPEIGPQVKVRMPADLVARVDELADEAGVSRSEWVRRAVEAAARPGARRKAVAP